MAYLNESQSAGRCPQAAVGLLVSPDTLPVGAVCWDHGVGVVVEYAIVLGEVWTVQPLPRDLQYPENA